MSEYITKLMAYTFVSVVYLLTFHRLLIWATNTTVAFFISFWLLATTAYKTINQD